MSGQRISDMDRVSSLGTSGYDVPVIPTAGSANYKFDLAAGLSFTNSGTGAITVPIPTKLLEGRSIADYGAVANLTTNNTAAFTATVTALPTFGGAIHVNGGNYRVNEVINQDCVILRGDGGCVEYDQITSGFHGAFAKGLRPYATGAGTATLQIGDDDQYCRRLGLHDLAISGDDGSGPTSSDGNQADAALAIKGGVVHLSSVGLGARDGVVTIDMNPSNGYPITCNYISHFDWRNNTLSSSARVLKVQRHDVAPEPAGAYFTHNIFTCGHINGPANGYAIEVDAGTSPGIGLQMSHVYCDLILSGHGVLLNGSAWLEGWDVTLDPGTTGAVIVKTTNVKAGGGDITAYMKGFIKHGGQKFEWGGGEQISIPDAVQFFIPSARIHKPFLSDTIYFSPESDPFSTTVYMDWATDAGPMRLNGIQFKFMDATDSNSSTSGSVQLVGGMGVGKSIVSGAAIGATTGFFIGADKVVGARDTGWTAMTGSGSKGALAAAAAGTASVGYVQAELQAALNRIAALEARMKSYDAALIAHGLIGA